MSVMTLLIFLLLLFGFNTGNQPMSSIYVQFLNQKDMQLSTSAVLRVRYHPPNLGIPSRREGGGTR